MTTAKEWVKFLHIISSFAFVGGVVSATLVRLIAMSPRRKAAVSPDTAKSGEDQLLQPHSCKPSEVATLLKTVRPALPVVGLGLLSTVGFGFWLAHLHEDKLNAPWLIITYVLLGYVLLVGGLAGRDDRHTRELAEELQRQGDAPSDTLWHKLREPLNLLLNMSMLAAIIGIIAMMVFRPGQEEED